MLFRLTRPIKQRSSTSKTRSSSRRVLFRLTRPSKPMPYLLHDDTDLGTEGFEADLEPPLPRHDGDYVGAMDVQSGEWSYHPDPWGDDGYDVAWIIRTNGTSA